MTDWSLAGGGGFGNALALGMQLGNQIKQQRADNALSAYGQNPGQDTIGGVYKADPRLGIQVQRLEAQRVTDQREQQAASQKVTKTAADQLPIVGRLLTYAKQGPEQWAQAVRQAHAMGIDVSQVPQQFDPNWADQQIGFINAVSTPQGQEALSAAGKQAADMGYRPGTPEFHAKVSEIWQADQRKFYPLTPGGGLAGVGADGAAQLVIAPNDGSQAIGAPAARAGASKTINGKTYYQHNGKWYDEPVGGPTPQASGVFPGSQR